MQVLENAVQKYAWGREGSSSAVALLKQLQMRSLGKEFAVGEEESFAELWIGTHSSGPSLLPSVLSDYVRAHPEVLSAKVQQMFGDASLPFLLKVLSVKQALSIQAHPDLELARKLHREQPEVYKDPNHKPEMALAVTDFEVLCGFRRGAEVLQNLKGVPELRALVGEETVRDVLAEGKTEKEILKKVFSAVMLARDDAVKREIGRLAERLSKIEPEKRTALEKSILTIHLSYPGDVGVICPYILNHFTLRPGEAIYLGANEPHAYLFGDCVECMANSDNVVRAGLTPKLRDSATLISMLTYESRDTRPLTGERVCEGVVGYFPPVHDFQVEHVVGNAERTVRIPAHKGPCVGIVVEGKGEICGKAVGKGSSFFVPCGVEMPVLGQLSVFIASVNRSVFEQ